MLTSPLVFFGALKILQETKGNMVSFSGPIPLILVVTVLMTLAFFFTYRHVTVLQGKLLAVEASLPGAIAAGVRQELLRGVEADAGYDDDEEDEYDEEDEDDEEGLADFVEAATQAGARAAAGVTEPLPAATLVVQTTSLTSPPAQAQKAHIEEITPAQVPVSPPAVPKAPKKPRGKGASTD